jgi:hypothetical protein
MEGLRDQQFPMGEPRCFHEDVGRAGGDGDSILHGLLEAVTLSGALPFHGCVLKRSSDDFVRIVSALTLIHLRMYLKHIQICCMPSGLWRIESDNSSAASR